MAFSPDSRTFSRAPAATAAAAMDEGLRAYMLRVYNWMTSGLLLTGIIAYAVANTSLLQLFYQPHRTAITGKDGNTTVFMPASTGKTTGVKILSVPVSACAVRV